MNCKHFISAIIQQLLVSEIRISIAGFDPNQYNRIRMIVDFCPNGYHTCSFSAINDDTHSVVDLGIAFVCVPDVVWPTVGVASRKAGESLRMEYNSGPERKLKYKPLLQSMFFLFI